MIRTGGDNSGNDVCLRPPPLGYIESTKIGDAHSHQSRQVVAAMSVKSVSTPMKTKPGGGEIEAVRGTWENKEKAFAGGGHHNVEAVSR